MNINDEDILKELGDNPEYLAEAPAEEADAPVEEPTEEVAEEPEEVEEAPEAEEEETLESLVEEPQEPVKEVKEDTVPLAALLEVKRELKELKAAQKDKSVDLTNAELEDLAQEYDVDASFISKLAASIKKEALEEADKHYRPLIEKQEKERIEAKKEEMFNKLFENAVKGNERLAEIANKDVIKALAFNPENSKKKVSELIKEVYGKVAEQSIPEKKSFESYSPSDKKADGIDFSSMDAGAHEQIANDPKLREKYGDYLVKNINW